MKFQHIEGLRAWLAWTVVFHHLILFTGCSYFFANLAKVFSKAGDYSVFVFIVISGFVITNLLLVKKEPYKLYIIRRFLRLYPVYIISLTLGVLGTYLGFETFLNQQLHTPVTAERMSQQYLSFTSHFVEHLIAHLTMLHGLISNNILYESQYMFLSPAWSLSLEWQFYLIAPLVIWMVIKGNFTRLLSAIVFVSLYIAYQRGFLGSFILPSNLAGVYFLFAFGIFCRFNFELIMEKFYYGLFFIILLSPFIPLNLLLPCAFFYGFIFVSNFNNLKVKSWIQKLFASDFFLNQGSRSYCVYLIHVPLIQISAFIFLHYLKLSQLNAFLATALISLSATFLLSKLISEYVEKPVIAYGKSLKALDTKKKG